jgi:hypothetical protein
MDATAGNLTGCLCCRRSLRRRRCGRLAALAGAARTARRAEVDSSEYQLKFAILGHRILVLLPKELLLHQHVDVRRTGAWAHLPLEQSNRPNVLLAAEHQLRFLLALSLVPPRREHCAHQDRHHREGHEQRRHRVAGVSTCFQATFGLTL